MKLVAVAFAVLACGSRDAKPVEESAPAPTVPRAPDQMDERMRHCPLALDGAVSTLEDIPGGVRFTVKPPAAALADARRRASHIVDFAARKTRAGHGGFDGKGGGRMKNCPVVTDDVAIAIADVEHGVQLDITSRSGAADQLREETRRRVEKFPFVGATIEIPTPSKQP